MRGFLRAAACGLLGTVLVAAADVSRALAEDDEPSFDRKIINNVLNGLGLRSGAGDIDYRERSPLVLPPKINLPPPQANAAAGTPGWPVDPDVKRRKEESNRRRDEVEESRPLRPNELIARLRGPSGRPPDGPGGARLSGRTIRLAVRRQEGRSRAIHRRAAAHHADRAADRLPDPVAQSALYRQAGPVAAEGSLILRFRYRPTVSAAGADSRILFLPVPC